MTSEVLYYRDGSVSQMSSLTKLIFVKTLPKYLWLKEYEDEDAMSEHGSTSSGKKLITLIPI